MKNRNTTKKTTCLSLNPELHKQLKMMAVRKDTTMSRIVTVAIENQLRAMDI